MKTVASFLVLGLCGFLAVGVADRALGQPAANAPAPSEPFKLLQQQAELNAQFALLKELTAQHRQRAEEAGKLNQQDKARWETDLAKELVDKTDQAATRLDELTRQRASQESNLSTTNAKPEPPDQDEAAYLARVNTELWRVEEELKAALDISGGFSAQLLTNNTPEDVARISYQVQENNVLRRFLSRERADLEIRKLEYRALKKK